MVYRDSTPMDGTYKNNNIMKIANAIRTKEKGIDTREAMAQALEKVGEIAMGAVTDPDSVANEVYDMANNAYKVAITKADKKEVEDRLSQISLIPIALPNYQTLNEKFPNGSEGIFITIDTGHKWIWTDGKWKDFGVYQAVGVLGFNKTIIWNSLSSNVNANSLESGIYYIAIQSSDKEKANYFHDVLNLPYFINQNIALGSLSVTLTDDRTGGYQSINTSVGVWTRAKSAGKWTEWNNANDFSQTIVWNSTSNTINANNLSNGKYFVAIDGTNSKTANYLHDKLNLPLIKNVERGTLLVNMSQSTESFSGIQILTTDENIYIRSVLNSKWGQWAKIKDTKALPEFKKTIVLNSIDNVENADSLGSGIYFVAIDSSTTNKSEHFSLNLNWPLLKKLEVGVFFSQINSNGDGSQIYVTDSNIYIRSKAGVINKGQWTNWKSVIFDGNRPSTSNKTVFLGDSRMAGLLGNGKGYASPRPYEIIAKNNGLVNSSHAVSGTGYLYSVDGTNAQTTANSLDFSQYDNAVFAYGINDYLKNEALGSANDTIDSDSVIASFLKTLNKVFSDNPTCNVVVVLPFNASNRGNENSRYALGTKNTAQTPYTLEEMQNVLADVCEKYNIPYVDTRKGCSINLLNLTYVLGDGLHPTTQKEYELYAKWLSAEISSKLQPIY